MKNTLINIGIFEIRWYSVLILIAFLIGFYIVYKQKSKLNLSEKEITDMLFYLILFALIGDRIYYVIFNFDYYFKYPMDILKVWEGGLAIHGGLIAGLTYLIYFCKSKKIDILRLTDIIVLALPLGQAIGRWGNFFNQEAYGTITSYKYLKSIHIPNFIIDGMYINHHYYHPTFLYESIWCFFIFLIILIVVLLKINKRGLCTSIYLIMYGIERFFIESMRQDSLMLFNIKIAQIVSLFMIFMGILILIYNRRKNYD